MDYSEYLHDARRADSLIHSIENYEKCIKAIPTIKEIIKRFDKKVYNKKLDTALAESFNHYTSGYRVGVIKNPYNKDYIEMYLYNRGSETLLRLNVNDMPDGKRIDAEAWNALLDKKYEYLTKKIDDINNCIPKVHEYKRQLEALNETALSIYNSIPSELHEAFYIRRPNFSY